MNSNKGGGLHNNSNNNEVQAHILIVPLGQPAVQAWALGYTGMRHVRAAACNAPWHQASAV